MTSGEAVPKSVTNGDKPPIPGQGSVVCLYNDLVPEIRRFLLGVLKDLETTEDVLQATFLKVLEQGHQARQETSRGWLFQVAFREALAVRRSQVSQEKGQRRFASLSPLSQIPPDSSVVLEETITTVRKALNQIPEEQRRIILARIYEDKTFAQIAEDLQIPLGTVLSRMRRGLEKLRTTLKPGG